MVAIAALAAALPSNRASGQEATSARAPLAEQIEAQRRKITALKDQLAAVRAGGGVYVPSQEAIEALKQEELKRELRKQEYAIVLLRAFGFENPYNIVARADVADRLRLTSISDLAGHFPDKSGVLVSGFDKEFHRRPDGYRGLEEHYGFRFDPEPESVLIGKRYEALMNGTIALTDGFGTDGHLQELLDKGEARILEDDRGFFSRYPYPAAPLVRADALREHPEIGEILNRLADSISTGQMWRLNHEVEVRGRDAKTVAEDFVAGLPPEAKTKVRDGSEGTVIIAGKNFSEQDILCEIMAIMIEGNSDLAVVRAKKFGDSAACFDALRSGGIDMYAEYAGTAMIRLVKRQMGPGAAESVPPAATQPAVLALGASLTAEDVACEALKCAQAFLVECASPGGTSGNETREVVTARRRRDHAIFWRNRLENLAGVWDAAVEKHEEHLGADARVAAALKHYADEARGHHGLVKSLVGEMESQRAACEDRASLPIPGAEYRHAEALERERDLLGRQADLLEEVAEFGQNGLRTELAASRASSARSRSDEDTPTLDAVAAGRLVESLEAARSAALETKNDFLRAAAFLRDQAAIKRLDADSMRRRAAEAERAWTVSVWTAAGTGGIALFLIFASWVILRRRELRVARAIVAMVILLIGGAVAAMQFEASRRVGVAFLGAAGVTGVVIGIAARSTVSNAFAGVMIFLSRPIRIGDTVVIDGERGTIEDMTLMYTAFRTWDHRRVMIPNEKMSDKQIINYSIRDTRIRAKVPIRLDYAADLARAEEILTEIAKNSEHRSKTSESDPVVWPMEMDDRAVLLWVAVWADNPDEEWALKCEILKEALARFREEGIPLPRQRYERLDPGGGAGDERNA